MSGSSPANIFAGVSPRHILALLDLLQKTGWRRRDYVESRYREFARDFDSTLSFLARLGWLRISSNDIDPDPGCLENLFQSAERPEVRLLTALLDCLGPHQPPLITFLSRFSLREGALTSTLRGESSLTFAPVRDFLMELGAVTRNTDTTYLLDTAFAGAFLSARTLRTPSSRATARRRQVDREEFGLQAELAVLEFERQRVGPRLADSIRHISSTRPFACYDLLSVTVDGESATPRYIEVKAVSADSPEFHWSAAEIEAAEVMRARYFLYLVPVVAAGKFDLDRLNIVSDPFVSVYQDDVHWTKQPTQFLCRPAMPKIS